MLGVRVKAVGVLAVLVASSACFTYQPVEIADLRPELEVRARVSAQFAEETAEFIGREERLLEGIVESTNGEGLMLLVPVVTAFERRGGSLNQRLTIPRSHLLEVELKERDNTRTALVVGVVAAIGGGILIQQLTSDERASTDPIRDPPDEDWIIRIPIRIGW